MYEISLATQAYAEICGTAAGIFELPVVQCVPSSVNMNVPGCTTPQPFVHHYSMNV